MPTANRDQVIQLFSLLSDMARREQSNQALAAVRGGGQVVGGPGGSASANFGPRVSGQMPDPMADMQRQAALGMMSGSALSAEEMRSMGQPGASRQFGGLVDEYGYDPAVHEFMEEVRRRKWMELVAQMSGAAITSDELRGVGYGRR
jgi:hypothetical protein